MPSEIPLTSDPSIIQNVVLEERNIGLQTKFNPRYNNGYWTLDILENGVGLVYSLPMVLGADLLEHITDLGLGALIMVDTDLKGKEATSEDLGTNVLLIHYTEEEIAALRQVAAESIAITGGNNFSDGFDEAAFR